MSDKAPDNAPDNAPDSLPRITIGLLVYNGEQTLGPTVDALLAQTHRDFILLISDNASDDGTRNLCEEYQKRDDRIRYVRQPHNLGVVGNANDLIERAETELFMWHAVDDLSHPRLLEACLAALDARPEAVLAYVQAETIDEAGRVLPTASRPLDLGSSDVVQRFEACLEPIALTENVIYGLMRRRVVLQTQHHGPFAGGDRAFCAELTLYGPFARIDEPLFQRRVPTHLKSHAEVELYNTGRREKSKLREWRILRHNLVSVLRAPLSKREQARLLGALLRRMGRARREYLVELKMLVSSALRG